MKRLTDSLTYANVVSTVGLFLLLGGGAYAASRLPVNTVGTKQLKNNAVTWAKIKNGVITSSKIREGSLLRQDFAVGQLSAGPQGAAGEKGEKGKQGEPGPLVTSLPSGKSLRGIFSFAGHGTSGSNPTEPISYQFPIASGPTTNVIGVSAKATSACPGSAKDPRAEPGNLCVYETRDEGELELTASNDIAGGKFGAVLSAKVPSEADFEFAGTWAVSAP